MILQSLPCSVRSGKGFHGRRLCRRCAWSDYLRLLLQLPVPTWRTHACVRRADIPFTVMDFPEAPFCSYVRTRPEQRGNSAAFSRAVSMVVIGSRWCAKPLDLSCMKHGTGIVEITLMLFGRETKNVYKNRRCRSSQSLRVDQQRTWKQRPGIQKGLVG